MSPEEIQHFLVIYDALTGDVDVESFGTDYGAAQDAYAEAERDGAESSSSLDIVLLSADSLATIKETHSSYFSGRGGKLRELLPG